MGQAYELPVVYGILAESSDGYAHALLIIHIQSNLGTVILCHIPDKLLRRAGKLKILRCAPEALQLLDKLLLRRLLAELHKYCCGMAVQNRNTDALA